MGDNLVSRRKLIAGGSMFLLAGCSGIDRTTSTGSILEVMNPRSLGASQRKKSPSRSNVGDTNLVTPKQAGAIEFNFSEGFAKLNALRNREGLLAFKNDSRLQKAAQDYANLMAVKGKYGHEIGPNTQFKKRISAVGFDNSSGENLGVGYASIDDAIKGWLDSADHKRNMLKPHYTLAGLAYAYNNSGINPQYTHLWVLIMGKDDGLIG